MQVIEAQRASILVPHHSILVPHHQHSDVVGRPLGDARGRGDFRIHRRPTAAVCARAASTVLPAVGAMNGLSERSSMMLQRKRRLTRH